MKTYSPSSKRTPIINEHQILLMKFSIPFFLLSFFIFMSCSQQSADNGEAGNPNFENTAGNQDSPLNKFADDSLRLIYTYQDDRNTAALLPYLKHQNTTYLLAATQAFASVQDTTALQSLAALLTHAEAPIREAAAYAIGQIGSISVSQKLIETLEQETEEAVKIKLLEAIGKCASPSSIKFLATFYGDKNLAYGVALGLFRGLLKGQSTEAGLVRIVNLLNSSSTAQTRIIASTYLARARKQNLNTYLNPISQTLRNDNNPFVRMNCARALAQTNPTSAEDELINALQYDENYLVKINALRAMNSLGGEAFKDAAFNALADKNIQVGIVASELISKHATKKDQKALKTQLETVEHWQIKSNLLAALTKVKAKNSKLIISRLKESDNIYEQGYLLVALANDIEKYGIIKERLIHATHPVIKNYAMMALASVRTHEDYERLKKQHKQIDQEFIEVIKHCLASKDIALIYHASLLLQNPKIDFKNQLESLDFIEQSLSSLTLPRDIEAYQALNKTLDYLKGNQSNTPIPSNTEKHAIDWSFTSKIPANQQIKIHTTKGEITLQLMVEETPGTVSEILQLIQKGFYDGKTFHRVVPNFVAQGGCPRGDGFGGLDYTIRSEFPPLYYNEGYVGMASAGKDTESCQWFITHSPTPHLDGRYTIFAKVISGMPIVHRLTIGDIIEQIEIMDTAPDA